MLTPMLLLCMLDICLMGASTRYVKGFGSCLGFGHWIVCFGFWVSRLVVWTLSFWYWLSTGIGPWVLCSWVMVWCWTLGIGSCALGTGHWGLWFGPGALDLDWTLVFGHWVLCFGSRILCFGYWGFDYWLDTEYWPRGLVI
jgi:hypothetical protein